MENKKKEIDIILPNYNSVSFIEQTLKSIINQSFKSWRLIIVDDFADDPTFSRNSKLLHSLFTRGRHSMISTIVATQKFSAIHPIIRTNATELFVYRLRNYKDLESFLEELSALYDKKTLLELYKYATDAPYSFLYVKLTAKTKRPDVLYEP